MNNSYKWLGWAGLWACLGLVQPTSAQTQSPTEVHRHGYGCYTQHMNDQAMEQHPELRQTAQQLDDFTRRIVAERQAERRDPLGRARLANNGPAAFVIPVVIHVIHDFGPENISRAQVLDAMRILNEDFRFLSRDTGSVSRRFRPIAADAGFEFRLATIDPNGNCTDGITRTRSPLTHSAGDNVKDLISWDTQKYFNVWIVSNIASGAGAYAYYPGRAPRPQYEGIVNRASQFGSIGASSSSNFAARTFTHEVGHCFNLPHTWGSTNQPGEPSNCNIDDGVADTPNTVGVTGQGCPLNMVSCGDTANVENYMDYSNCGRMFTLGQADRMAAAALSPAGGRSNLWSVANLIATGTTDTSVARACFPRVGGISINIREACINANVTFTASNYNLTPGDTTLSYRWIVDGAVQDTGFGTSFTTRFVVPGLHNVRYTVRNQYGADSLVFQNAIFITDPSLRTPFGQLESFETPGILAQASPTSLDWRIMNSGAVGWELTTEAAFSGNYSLRARARNMPTGTSTTLVSPTFDITGLGRNAWLELRYAYAPRNTNNTDVLRPRVSYTCGQTIVGIAGAVANSLTNNLNTVAATGNNGPDFIPTDTTQWKVMRRSLNLNSGQTTAQVRIEFESGGGNRVYIDDIFLYDITTGLRIPLFAENIHLKVVPNPAQAGGHIEFETQASGRCRMQIQDLLGRSWTAFEGLVEARDRQKLPIEQLSFLQSGFYIVTLETPQGLKKLTFTKE